MRHRTICYRLQSFSTIHWKFSVKLCSSTEVEMCETWLSGYFKLEIIFIFSVWKCIVYFCYIKLYSGGKLFHILYLWSKGSVEQKCCTVCCVALCWFGVVLHHRMQHRWMGAHSRSSIPCFCLCTRWVHVKLEIKEMRKHLCLWLEKGLSSFRVIGDRAAVGKCAHVLLLLKSKEVSGLRWVFMYYF